MWLAALVRIHLNRSVLKPDQYQLQSTMSAALLASSQVR
jgi:hypothetical protein